MESLLLTQLKTQKDILKKSNENRHLERCISLKICRGLWRGCWSLTYNFHALPWDKSVLLFCHIQQVSESSGGSSGSWRFYDFLLERGKQGGHRNIRIMIENIAILISTTISNILIVNYCSPWKGLLHQEVGKYLKPQAMNWPCPQTSTDCWEEDNLTRRVNFSFVFVWN